ncbi:hypothetical protein PYW07_004855 [Mythimna separata]|uniref:Vitellogenin domain-containing protein n=1 Tax=Mythimna separata TaxID=271217 RepID=A0AAD8DP05_MYTSE|nr:hypothetical protein PYW07_004855 [Mythimna separata]
MYANVNGVSAMRGLALVLALCALGAAAGGRSLLSAPAAFELESTLQLNDAARADREVGYKLRARLDVAPRAAADHDQLLQFRLHSPKLYLRGKHVNADFMAYDSVWDSYSDSTFYAHWSSGELKAAYLDPGELPDVLNYKKSLLSLFQIQMHDGEYNETDVSGPCRVLYETISTDVFRKIKVACDGDVGGAVSSARRVQRYTLAGGQLAALHAEELLLLGPAALGLKARSWHTLRRADPAPSAPPLSALPAALQALPAALQPATLALQPTPGDHDDHEELGAALAAGAAALAGEAARAGGGADAAAAMLELLPALRRANHSAAAQLLQRADMHDHLTGLCRLLGLAGTAGAHAAADDFLQLRAREPLVALAHTYLDALALAPEPDDSVLQDLLRLGDDAREPSVRAHALLAAAAAARAHPAAAARARDALARGLARCRDAECRALRLRALGNLRSADTVDVLLQHAERAERPVALAALLALDDAPSHALTFARLDRLQALALRGTAALEVRGAALDLLVRRRAAVPTPLAQVAHELHARGPHELRRVLWQRVEALAPAHEELAALPTRLGPALRGWDAAAHGGTSSVLVRAPGWALGGWRAELQSLQLASAGLLRRGEVRLLAYDEHGDSYDALTVSTAHFNLANTVTGLLKDFINLVNVSSQCLYYI